MRRLWVLAVAAVVALVVAVSAVASRGDGSGDGAYRVRAIFDNASFIIAGGDVKVAGVNAGTIESVDLTPENKAVAVLRITDPAFQDFRRDARCNVGLQSLIGEQYVECTPTQKRGEGVPVPGPLPAIRRGEGQGQHLLPVSQTSSPVGPDLLANIMRVPQQERLRLIVAELGTGLAGNGAELRTVIRRANPTLQQANQLVEILAKQNRTIERLVAQSDEALAPLANRTDDLKSFIRRSGETAEAVAARGDALEEDLRRLPGFLDELEPAARRIGALSDQLGPAVANLTAKAPQLNETVERLGAFSRAATPALTSLGDAADQGRETFPRIMRLANRLDELGTPLAPLAKSLGDLAGSVNQTGGLQNLLRLVYFYTGSLNGKDATAHYLRSNVYASNCIDRQTAPTANCQGTFDPSATGAPVEEDAESRAAARAADVTDARKRLQTLLGPEGTR
ncbi:MlaD family protein [Patulibacter sp. S7RM1-6]